MFWWLDHSSRTYAASMRSAGMGRISTPARTMAGSTKRTCVSVPPCEAVSKMALEGRRISSFAGALTTMGSWPLAPKRMAGAGTQMTPALAVGANTGPALSCALASNSGCSGAPRRRSCGLALNVTVVWKIPASAVTPAPTRSWGSGFHEAHTPGMAMSDPLKDPMA